MVQRGFCPGQPTPHGVARRHVACQHCATVVGQSNRVARRDLWRNAKTHQSVKAELGHQSARETALLGHRNHQHQQSWAGALACRPGEDRLTQISSQFKRTAHVICRYSTAVDPLHAKRCAGRCLGGHDGAAGVQPRDGLQFGELADEGIRLELEFGDRYVSVASLTRQSHQLFLALDQPQAQALLRVLDVPEHRLFAALHFLIAQIGDGDHNRR